MSEYWRKALEAAEAAEAEAKRLRLRYGSDAERRLDELIREAARASRRGEMENVRKALRWT
jgi:ribonuclease HI